MDIKQSPSGNIVKAGTGYTAFVPHPLPPQFEWTSDLVNSLSRADFLLGKLSREGSMLPNPHLLIRPFVVREAVLSSKIEGTQATLEDILVDEVGGVRVEGKTNDAQEVRNYINALNYGIKRLNDLPLSLRLIKELHEKLMHGARGGHATPGEFRRTQNWIGLPGCTLMTAKFVPPPIDELMNTLGAFELFLHDRTLPPLIHIALCHYQFEAIHPFLDGNGRIGRLLIILLMIERNLLPSPLLYISAFFEATRAEYYRYLYNVSALGSWQEWLSYFLNGVAVQSADALSRAERINTLIDEWQKLVVGDTPLLTSIIKQCAVNPFLTATNISERFAVSFTTVQRAITKLESLGIINQTNATERNRLYCATKILAILEEPTTILLNEE
jgi:cell filamentation protein, protein adenylyltransferase